MGRALALGVKSGNLSTRKMDFLSIAVFALLFATISLSNFVMIFSGDHFPIVTHVGCSWRKGKKFLRTYVNYRVPFSYLHTKL